MWRNMIGQTMGQSVNRGWCRHAVTCRGHVCGVELTCQLCAIKIALPVLGGRHETL